MSIPPAQQQVAAFLRGLAGGEPIETHISAVYLGADTVWKLKKAVRLSFLDFTSVDQRRHFAEREIALNAPHAPGLYRDVVAVVRFDDGSVGFAPPDAPTLDPLAPDPLAPDPPAPDPPVLDWILRMARVPAEDFLDAVAARGALSPGLLDAIADAVALYHANLPALAHARSDMAGVVAGNALAALQAGLPAERLRVWREAASDALREREAWLLHRQRAGYVRRAHGDLHLGNLCLWNGRPVPFDALEFDEDLATIDLAYDLAFLLMDLEFRTGRSTACRVLGRYVARTADADLVAGLPPFLSSRALIRAHVSARLGRMAESERYLDLAMAYLRPAPAMVVAVGGLPGTGKTTLARALAPRIGAAPGALVLRSDEIRKRIMGVPPEDRLPPAGYAPAVSARVFDELASLTVIAARSGHAVVADATFLDLAHRAQIENAARGAGVPFHGLWLQARLTDLEARVAARTGDASDATVEVLRAAAPNDPGPGTWASIDAGDADRACQLAIMALRPHVVLC